MAAITIATMLMYEQTNESFFEIAAYALLAAVSLLVGFLVARTVRALVSREICVEEG